MYVIEEVKNIPFKINIRESISFRFRELYGSRYFRCYNKDETVVLAQIDYPDLIFSIWNTETGVREDLTWNQVSKLVHATVYDFIVPNTKIFHSIFDGCGLYDGLSVLRWMYKGIGFKIEQRNEYYFLVFDNDISYFIYQGQLREGLDAFKRDLVKIALLT